MSPKTSAQVSTFLFEAEHHLLVEIKILNIQIIKHLPLRPLMTDNDAGTYPMSHLEKIIQEDKSQQKPFCNVKYVQLASHLVLNG